MNFPVGEHADLRTIKSLFRQEPHCGPGGASGPGVEQNLFLGKRLPRASGRLMSCNSLSSFSRLMSQQEVGCE